MDEKQAWQCFAQTGRVEDYIRYAQIKGQAAAGPQEVQCAAHKRTGAGKDAGACYPGAAGGGK